MGMSGGLFVCLEVSQWANCRQLIKTRTMQFLMKKSFGDSRIN